MTMSDDLPREYHERDTQEARERHLALISRLKRTEIFALFSAERNRQIAKWGWDAQTHTDGTGGPGFVMQADIYRQACEFEAGRGDPSWRSILLEEVFEAMAETDPARLEKELVQVGAVVTNWLEDLRSRAE